MPRIGRNPNKRHNHPEHARITAAVITHIPHLEGYFKDKLEVLRLSLDSLIRNADMPLDLMVFDNASCPEAIGYMQGLCRDGTIRYLVQSSVNVGLVGGYRAIVGMAPGEIIAWADDDVYYYPNWLSRQVEVLEAFPDAGKVSGFYLRGNHPSMAELLESKGLDVEMVTAPETFMEEFCRDTSYASAQAYYDAQAPVGITDLRDLLVTSQDVSAYAGCVCWQGISRKRDMIASMPLDNPEDAGFTTYDNYFHWAIQDRGFLKLSTTERVVRHIGNVITPEYEDLARSHGIEARATVD